MIYDKNIEKMISDIKWVVTLHRSVIQVFDFHIPFWMLLSTQHLYGTKWRGLKGNVNLDPKKRKCKP